MTTFLFVRKGGVDEADHPDVREGPTHPQLKRSPLVGAGKGPVPEIVRIVADDLQYLRKEWNGDIDDPALRRGSTVLRRLLVHGDLQRAWKGLGLAGEPKIEGFSVEPTLRTFDGKRIVIATAGGAVHKGVQLSGQVMLDYGMTDEEALAHRNLGIPVLTLPLGLFVEGVCMVVRGERVRRRHVINYVANKLGGDHYDPARGKRRDDRIYSLLDQFSAKLLLLGKPVVYFELLSIGQAIANSTDVAKYSEKAAT